MINKQNKLRSQRTSVETQVSGGESSNKLRVTRNNAGGTSLRNKNGKKPQNVIIRPVNSTETKIINKARLLNHMAKISSLHNQNRTLNKDVLQKPIINAKSDAY
jgi:hypothetical protein